MKKFLLFLVSVILAITLCFAGCSTYRSENSDSSSIGGSSSGSTVSAVTDESVSASETTAEFSLTTTDGVYSQSDNVYTITAAGTYTVSGYLQGQILVEAGEDDAVVIELNGATIKNSEDSPIKILSADSVDISAKKDTENVIVDQRTPSGTYDTDAGKGAIYAKTDLKLKGTGTLVITGNYNNGIHTTKDLTVQKLSLKVTAYNNAIKGNDSITVKSGTVIAISTDGDGIKTENTDANKNGETRGDITFTGGSVAVYAAGDAIQSAHNFIMSEDADGNSANLTVYTGSYSGYTSSSATTDSYKGIKVENELDISSGTVNIKSYDDGLHADYGTAFDTGETGTGTINISGGVITINVYSPTTATAGGQFGPSAPGGNIWRGGNMRGFSTEYAFNQQAVSGADAIHADNALNISGGTINIDSAYEGLEANHITVSGGKTYVAGNDDGINASKKINETPTIVVSGGYLDVTVSPSGNRDGIDSNGNYTQTGGVVITRGPNSDNMAAIDADGTVSISGGTLIVLGYGNVKTSGSGIQTYSLSLHSSGSHTVNIDGTSYTFTNAYSYGRTTCYSSVSVSA